MNDIEATHTPGSPWYLISSPSLSLWDRLRLLLGARLCVRFDSPDGNCHAVCRLSASVQRHWPEERL